MFRQVRIHRNNRAYGLLMEVCALAWECLLPDEPGTSRRFRDFTKDDGKMRLLFQRFVQNFYTRRQTEFKVKSPQFQWTNATAMADQAVALPLLRTDIVLGSPERTVVMDTKFTSRPFDSCHESKTLR
jgi:5-methylcytosine-specific restriction enzyme subunit McrC